MKTEMRKRVTNFFIYIDILVKEFQEKSTKDGKIIFSIVSAFISYINSDQRLKEFLLKNYEPIRAIDFSNIGPNVQIEFIKRASKVLIEMHGSPNLKGSLLWEAEQLDNRENEEDETRWQKFGKTMEEKIEEFWKYLNKFPIIDYYEGGKFNETLYNKPAILPNEIVLHLDTIKDFLDENNALKKFLKDNYEPFEKINWDNKEFFIYDIILPGDKIYTTTLKIIHMPGAQIPYVSAKNEIKGLCPYNVIFKMIFSELRETLLQEAREYDKKQIAEKGLNEGKEIMKKEKLIEPIIWMGTKEQLAKAIDIFADKKWIIERQFQGFSEHFKWYNKKTGKEEAISAKELSSLASKLNKPPHDNRKKVKDVTNSLNSIP